MLIKEPKAEYWPQTNIYEHIANIASVCYHSPKKEGEKAKKMVEGLIKRNHISTTRHASCYFIVTNKPTRNSALKGELVIYKDGQNPYIEVLSDDNNIYYVATNVNFLLDHPELKEWIEPYQVTPEEFMKHYPELMRFTFCLTTQLSTSRELNRKSPNCIMEESTRYILYSENSKAEPAIVRPHWLHEPSDIASEEEAMYQYNKEKAYIQFCEDAFKKYSYFIKELGMKQEDARGILPLDTKTTVIYTYSVKEWSDIFKLRYLDMTGKSHPNCKVIMGLVLKEFNKLGYTLNEKGDLIYN